MKKGYTVDVGNVISPVANREVALFTAALASPVTQAMLSKLGISIPASIQVSHHTGTDDPPDLAAFGLGWECTEFPPDQSALDAVHQEQGAMLVPGYSQTAGDVRKIRQLATPYSAYPAPFAMNDEVAALKRVFLEKVIGGPKSKDIPGNDVLLLDQRACHWPDAAEIALKQALGEKKPLHIRSVLLVRWQQVDIDYSKPPLPVVVQLFPT